MKTGAYTWTLVVIILCASSVSATATKICLQSKISNKKIYGELLSFTGRQWEIATDFGRMKLTTEDAFPCEGPIPEPPGTVSQGDELRLAGSNTVGAALVPSLAIQLLKRDGSNPIVDRTADAYTIIVKDERRTLRIEAKGSSTGFQALKTGEAEIAMSSRPIDDTEVAAIAKVRKRGMQDPGREIVLALDAVVPIVAASSKLEAITLDQLRRIFSGSLVNWSTLGLGNAPITVHARDDESGTFDTFYSLVLEPYGAVLSSKARRYTSNDELAAEVSKNSNAIGFIAAGALSKAGPRVRGLALKGDCGIIQNPNTFNIKTEDYALGRRLFLYSIDKDRTGLAREFVDFAVSDAAQPYIVDAGFISQEITALDGNNYHRRLSEIAATADEPRGVRLARELRNLLYNAERLSVTFRFQTDSAVLDNKALQDGTRLARYLQTNAARRELILIGFADSTGDFSYNEILSQQRAAQAEALLRNNGITARRITTIGMSEELPAFCNTTESGRARNRRVEVWLR